MTIGSGTTLASAAVVENAPIVEAASITVATAVPIADIQAIPKEPIVSVEQYVKTYFAKNPILAEIAKCESRYRQYTTHGEVLRGRAVKQDVGVMQINETYHLETSEKLGYNIYTLDGNLAYGLYLYEKQGVQPWRSSDACWDN